MYFLFKKYINITENNNNYFAFLENLSKELDEDIYKNDFIKYLQLLNCFKQIYTPFLLIDIFTYKFINNTFKFNGNMLMFSYDILLKHEHKETLEYKDEIETYNNEIFNQIALLGKQVSLNKMFSIVINNGYIMNNIENNVNNTKDLTSDYKVNNLLSMFRAHLLLLNIHMFSNMRAFKILLDLEYISKELTKSYVNNILILYNNCLRAIMKTYKQILNKAKFKDSNGYNIIKQQMDDVLNLKNLNTTYLFNWNKEQEFIDMVNLGV